MQVLVQEGFPDYELIDSGDGMRLERYGQYRISRPDPQVLWHKHAPDHLWKRVDAVFDKSAVKGQWKVFSKLPENWTIRYNDLHFHARLTPFKHTGIFPEQALMWDWAGNLIKKSHRKIKVLNLFGYTGIASVAAAKAGAQVTHVDASKPSITWANENMKASGLSNNAIRWILDDALKFTKREVNRGNFYDGIIMDPPVYGHGPKKEAWDFYKHMPLLLENCAKILSPHPLFFLINAYAISSSAIMLGNIMEDMMAAHKGKTEYGELAIKETFGKRLLSTGIFAKWQSR